MDPTAINPAFGTIVQISEFTIVITFIEHT